MMFYVTWVWCLGLGGALHVGCCLVELMVLMAFSGSFAKSKFGLQVPWSKNEEPGIQLR